MNLPEALAIPATSKNPEAAWKYIEYMTSPERDKVRSLEIGTLPIWKAHFEDPELLALYPYWKNFGKQAEFARALPQLTWYDEWSYACLLYTSDIFYIITRGGPGEGTSVLSYYAYLNSFKFSRMGFGSAIAYLVIVLVIFIGIPYFRYMRKQEVD